MVYFTNKNEYAILATIAISLLPNLLLFLIPSRLFISSTQKNVVRFQPVLLCFASGGLLGDVFLHIIPLLLGVHSHSHGEHSHHDHDHHDHEIDHHHHHDHEIDHLSKSCEIGSTCNFEEINDHNFHHTEDHHNWNIYQSIGLEKTLVIELFVLLGFLVFLFAEKIANLYRNEGKDESSPSEKVIASNGEKKFFDSLLSLKPAGWLNLLADSMHNFMDGIAIGAAFSSGRGMATATFISVICHEIPHEIGDFSILIQNGMSKANAIKAQFSTAIAALVGTVVGLWATRNQSMEDILLAITSGGFIYISTVAMLPNVVQESSNVLQVGLEFIAFVLGIAMMVVIALNE